MATIKKYHLEGLCCPNCAAAIQREIQQVPGVLSAAVDFPTTSVTVEFDGGEGEMLKTVTAIAVEVDEEIVVKAV